MRLKDASVGSKMGEAYSKYLVLTIYSVLILLFLVVLFRFKALSKPLMIMKKNVNGVVYRVARFSQ